MSQKITSVKVTKEASTAGSVQTHDFRPQSVLKYKKRGHLFALISLIVKNETVVDQKNKLGVISFGREVLTRFHEEYYGDLDKSAFNSLKAAVERITYEFEPHVFEIEICAVSILKDTVYTAASGGAQVAILRNSMMAKILESRSNSTIAASGHSEPGDLMLMGTENFFGRVSEGVLKATLASSDLQVINDRLVPFVTASSKEENAGVIVLKFGGSETEGAEIKKIVDPETEIIKRKTSDVDVVSKASKQSLSDRLSLQKRFSLKDLTSRLPGKKIYVKEPEPFDGVSGHKKKVTRSVGVMLLVLLVISIGFGIRAKERRDTKELYTETLVSAKHEFEEAVNLYSLDPVRARELFNQSQQRLDELLQGDYEDEEIDILAELVASNRSKILGEYGQNPELFVDLSLLSEGYKGEHLGFSEGKIYVLDTQGKKIVEVAIDTKRTEVVIGPDLLDDPREVAAYSGRLFVLDGRRVFEVEEDEKSEIEEFDGENLLISVFAGNVYAVDKAESVIWRIAGSEGNFGEKRNWLAPGVEPDLTQIESLSIDGSIWMLSGSGKILQYSLGNQVNFEVSGVFPPLLNPSAIFTNDESESLYILEPDNKRVVVVTKEGEYIAQYRADDLSRAFTFVVSETEKRLVVLTGEKLLSIELQHLEE